MNAPRIIPAGPMQHGDILPMIRMVADLRERGRILEREAERGECGGVSEYHAAAELEERIRQPIMVAGRTLAPSGDDTGWRWRTPGLGDDGIQMTVMGGEWGALVSVYADNFGISVQTQGRGPTIAAALADAQTRYQAAIADTLLRMGGLLREVTK